MMLAVALVIAYLTGIDRDCPIPDLDIFYTIYFPRINQVILEGISFPPLQYDS